MIDSCDKADFVSEGTCCDEDELWPRLRRISLRAREMIWVATAGRRMAEAIENVVRTRDMIRPVKVLSRVNQTYFKVEDRGFQFDKFGEYSM